jgi:mRNA-degrading endonuclease RelE of RelBE toxin-antitoxin system
LYASQFTPNAFEDVKRLPKNARNSLKKQFLSKIHRDPIGCSEPLTGLLSEFRSFHFLDYRVVYRVFEDLKAIAVVGIGKKDAAHQAEIYRKLENLAKTGRLAGSLLDTIRLLADQ